MSEEFIHLHVHDEFSQLDGLGKAEQYADEASKLGFTSLALTNHGNVDGNIKFQKACSSKGIRAIHGCELYVVEDMLIKEKGDKRFHITTLVENEKGWTNLLKMLTKANVDGFYRRPRVDPKTVLEHSEGLVFMSACAGSVINIPWGEQLMLDLNDSLGSSKVYLEIMPHIMDAQISTNKKAIEMSVKYNIPLIATNDCHYPKESGAKSQEVLLAIQSRAKWDDPKRWKFDITGLHLKSYEEMCEAFKLQGAVDKKDYTRALRRTLRVKSICEGFEIQKLPVDLPKVPGYEDRDETELIEELVEVGFRKRLRGKSISKPEYRSRIKEELGLICDLGFQRYFLIVWELIDWCRKNDIMVGPGRGSSGGSLVAYLLYITDVDPIRHGLIFSRFISPARIDLPDIDMDFEDIKRDQIRKHLEDNYGYGNVSGLSTFSKLKGRAALRDVSRVFNLPASDVDPAAKSIVVRSGGDFRSNFTIEDAFETFEDGIKFKKKYPEVTAISIDLEGQIRGSGQHAAAMCVSAEDLSEGKRCNLCVRKGTIVANWDKYDSEHVGLMKLDVLGLSALTVLNQTRIMVKRNKGVEIEYDSIELDDPKVYDLIGQGLTVGAFQIGSMGLQSYCKDLGVDNFEMLVHATSLWRPGTLRSGMTTEFSERKRGKKYASVHPLVDEMTKDTLGIILYQEQVMRFMYELGGLPWKTCDTVRKVISKSQGEELFNKFKDLFIDGCRENKTLDEKTASKVWDELSSFGSYGFNKSHAVEYSMITYWDMWCKVRHPAEFMACLLTYGSNEENKQDFIDEAKRLGLKVMLPQIGRSHPTIWETSPDGKNLYAPFLEIKGVGEKTAEKLYLEREKSSSGFFESEGKKKSKKSESKITKLIKRIEDFDESKFTEDEIDELQEFFSFSISANPMRRVKGIYELLKPQITLVQDINFRNVDKETAKMMFGIMPEIKFGYRQNVLKASKGSGQKVDTAGMADSLGGVYGFLKDESVAANAMAVFTQEMYTRRKETVEHCGNKWILIEGKNLRRGQNNIFIESMALDSELLNCEFDGIRVNLIKRSLRVELEGLCECKGCALKQPNPIAPTLGRRNVMIVGEACSRGERKSGLALQTAGMNYLWKKLSSEGLSINSFHLTNSVKCYSEEAKAPTKSQIHNCSNAWLEKEISLNKPVLIFAIGSSAFTALSDKDSGILTFNGTTTWSAKHKAWICWGINPASIVHQESNKAIFDLAVDNFLRCLNNLGGRPSGVPREVSRVEDF